MNEQATGLDSIMIKKEETSGRSPDILEKTENILEETFQKHFHGSATFSGNTEIFNALRKFMEEVKANLKKEG
jgi:hypothetical protein